MVDRALISASPLTLQCVFEFVRDRLLRATAQGTSHIQRRHRFLVRVSRKACQAPDGPPAPESQRSRHAGTTLRPFADVFASCPYPPASQAVRAPLLPLCASRVSSWHPSSHCSLIPFRLAVAHEARARDNFRLTKTDFPNRHENLPDAARSKRLNERVQYLSPAEDRAALTIPRSESTLRALDS